MPVESNLVFHFLEDRMPHRKIIWLTAIALLSIAALWWMYLLFGLLAPLIVLAVATTVWLVSDYVQRRSEPASLEPEPAGPELSAPAEELPPTQPEVTASKKKEVLWRSSSTLVISLAFILVASGLSLLFYRLGTADWKTHLVGLLWTGGVLVGLVLLASFVWWLINKKPQQDAETEAKQEAKVPRLKFNKKVFGWVLVVVVVAEVLLYIRHEREEAARAEVYVHEFREALKHPMIVVSAADSARCRILERSLPVRSGWTGFVAAPDYYRITWQRVTPRLPYAVQNAQGDSAEYWPYQGPHDLPVSGAVRFRSLDGAGRIKVRIAPRFTCLQAARQPHHGATAA